MARTSPAMAGSIQRNICLFDHRPPAFRLGLERGAKFFWGRADRHHPDLLELRLDGGVANDGDGVRVDLVDDRAWRLGRNEEREETRHVELGKAGLRHGRQLRLQWAAL